MNKTKNQRFSKEDFFALKRKNLIELAKPTQIKTKSMLRRFFGIGLIFTLTLNGSVQAITWNEASDTNIGVGKSITAGGIKEIRDAIKWGPLSSGGSINYMDGNVGLGTTSPSQKLDIVGSAEINGNILNNNIYALNNTSHKYVSGGNSGSTGANILLYSGNHATSSVRDDMHLRTGGTSRVIIDGGGNVGIGVAPVIGFDVNRAIKIDHPNSAYDVWIQGGASTSGDGRNLALLGVDEDSGDRLYINYAGEYAGGVGIGNITVAAGLALDVDGKVGATEYCDSAGNNCTAASALGGTGDDLGNHTATQALNMNGQSISNANLITATGSVKANNYYTNNNTSTLYVTAGSSSSSGGNLLMYGESHPTASSQNDIRLRTGGTDRFKIEGDTGYVGIGTTAPGARLDVAGSINATGNIVTGGSVTVGNNVSSSLKSRHIYGKSNTSNATDTLYLNYNTGQTVNIGTGPTKSDLIVGGTASAATPTAATHLTTKSYVDAAIASGGGDNLGDHTATENIKLSGNWLSNDGGNEGIWVTSTGNVGVGTSTPAQKLQVDGNLTVNSIYSPSNESVRYLSAGTSSANGPTILMYGNAHSSTSSRNDIRFRADAVDLVKIEGTNGNVGIGTVSPSQKLHVSGGARIDGIAYFNQGGSQTTPQITFNGDTNTGIYSNAADTIRITSGGNLAFAADSSGNVGIGTAGPTAKLSVAGNITASNPTAASHVATKSYVDSAVTSGGDNLGDHTATTTLNIDNNLVDNVGSINFNQSAGHSISTNANGFVFNGGEGDADFLIYDDRTYTDVIYAGYTGNARITTYDTNEDLRLDANGTGSVYIADSVGVGTSSPTANLEVVGTIKSSGNITSNYIFTNNNTTNKIISGGSGSGAGANILMYGGAHPTTAAQSDMHLRTDGTSRLIVDGASGKIGIGVNPTIGLDVDRNLKINSPSAAYDVWLQGGTATSGDARNLALLGKDEDSGDELIINYAGEYAGGVGIGNTTVAAGLALDVDGKVGANEYCDSAGANCIAAAALGGTGDNLGNHTATTNLNIAGHRIEGTGNILARSNTPSEDIWEVYRNPASDFFGFYNRTDSAFRMIMKDDTGNVGIGTTTPSERLEVNGNIKSMGRNYYMGDVQHLFGDAASALYYTANHSTVTQQFFRDKENTVYGRIYGSGDGARFGLMDGDGEWGIKMEKDNFTQFQINGSEKMRIMASGNVGIGTTAPAHRLDVNGTAQANYLIVNAQNGASEGGEIQLDGAGSYADTYLDNFQGNTRAHGIVSGKYFEVVGGGGLTGNRIGVSTKPTGNLSTGAAIAIGDSDTGFKQVGDGTLAIYTNNSERVRINNIGNVGINKTNPSFPLDVAGIARAQRILLNADLAANEGAHVQIDRQNAARQGVVSFVDSSGASGEQLGIIGMVENSGDMRLIAQNNARLMLSSSNDKDILILPDGTGKVGVGIVVPSEKLDVAGNVKATAFIYSSDENLKKDIETTEGLETISQLRGVNFTWKDSDKKDVGLIAQEVEKVIPALVHTNEQNGEKSVDYGSLVAPLIEAVKEQQAQIESLQAEIEKLKVESQN